MRARDGAAVRLVPCDQDASSGGNETVRLTPHAELIRERLADRRAKLDGIDPVALDLAASGLAVLHDRLNGSMRELSGDHSPDYRGMQLSGKKSLHFIDLCYLMHNSPKDTAAALSAALEPLGYTVSATAPNNSESIHEENADFVGAVGRFEEALMHALADGRIDDNESQELWALLRSVLKEAADMLPCLKSNGGER